MKLKYFFSTNNILFSFISFISFIDWGIFVANSLRPSNYTHSSKTRKQFSNYKQLSKTTNSRNKEHYFSDTLAIIHYSFPASVSQVLLHYSLWNPVFPNMVIFGKWNHSRINEMTDLKLPVFQSSDDVDGFISQRTILRALIKFHSLIFKGYLYMQDDILVSPRNIVQLDKNRIWISDGLFRSNLTDWDRKKYEPWPWFNDPKYGIKKMQKILEEDVDILNTMIECDNDIQGHVWYYGSSDFFYFPSWMLFSFITTMEIFSSHNLFFEIAIPTWMVCFSGGRNQITLLSLCTSWSDKKRNDVSLFGYECPTDVTMIHPVKYSQQNAKIFAMEFLQNNSFSINTPSPGFKYQYNDNTSFVVGSLVSNIW